MNSAVSELPAIDGTLTPTEFAHYAEAFSVTEGYVTGKAVVAICGKIFVPSRDPQKFLICPKCSELAAVLFLGEEDDN